MANQFLVSVANVIGRDPNTGNVLFLGKANISTAFTVTMAKTDVRGGINNPLLYAYYHDRAVETKIESAILDKTLIALNAGTTVLNSAVTAVKNEGITLSSGSGTLSASPITGTNVSVIMPNGAIQTVAPTGGTIFVSGGNNQSVDVVYTYTVTADQIVGYTTNPPTSIDLTLTAEVRDNTNVVQYYFQVNMPRFVPSGGFALSLAANGVTKQDIVGQALVVSDPVNGDYYYKVTAIPAGTSSVPITSISTAPSTPSFSYALRPQTTQLSVLGIRGGLYANVNITTASSFVSQSGCATITISAGGLITSTSSVKAGDNTTFKITYFDLTSGSLNDYVYASVGA